MHFTGELVQKERMKAEEFQSGHKSFKIDIDSKLEKHHQSRKENSKQREEWTELTRNDLMGLLVNVLMQY